MGMRLRVFLNAEEARTLKELRQSTTVPQRVIVIRLKNENRFTQAQ
jgi:hypothetical protein